MKTYRIPSLDAIPEVATQFLNDFSSFQVFCFYANMGAGKTTFYQKYVRNFKGGGPRH